MADSADWPCRSRRRAFISSGYLYAHLVGTPIVQGAGLLFKKHAACGKFDFSLTKRKITEIVDSSERATWEESVQVLARHFSWEFENPA